MRYQRYSNGRNYGWMVLLFIVVFGGVPLVFTFLSVVFALLFNFLPLIAMGFITHRLIKAIGRNRTIHSTLNARSTHHKRFVELMVHIMIHIAKADGTISQSETQIIRQLFIQTLRFDSVQLQWVNDIIDAAKRSTDSLSDLAQEFSQQFEYESQLMLVNMVYNVAYSDGVFARSEGDVIDQLVRLLSISSFDHQRIKMAFEAQYSSVHQTSKLDQYYATLGLASNASKSDAKKAYRDLTKKYHPDKVHHLGKEFQHQAQQKMQEINHAYDQIMKVAYV